VRGNRTRRELFEHLVDLLPLLAALVGLILFFLFWGS